mmetsp:Transcript_14595/g.27620  ORF Transcript_14595/g.27620 Transcript_14595/m.27620 type:complete len:230 (-) Transcript_14595:1362-2051(-)
MRLGLVHLSVGLQKLPLCGDLLEFSLQTQLLLSLLLFLVRYLLCNLLNASLAICLLFFLRLALLLFDDLVPLLALLSGHVADASKHVGLLSQLLLLLEFLFELSLSLVLHFLFVLGFFEPQAFSEFGKRHLLEQALRRLLGRVEGLKPLYWHFLQSADLPDEVLPPLHFELVLTPFALKLLLLLLAHVLGVLVARLLHLGLRLGDELSILYGLNHQLLLPLKLALVLHC